jgi:hypothetical protein
MDKDKNINFEYKLKEKNYSGKLVLKATLYYKHKRGVAGNYSWMEVTGYYEGYPGEPYYYEKLD